MRSSYIILVKSFKPLAVLTYLLLIFVSANQTIAADPNCWNVVQLIYTANNTYSQPWNDVNLIATFTGPNSIQYEIRGFWDGGQTWKVRFAPTVPGQWSYQTACVQDAGLNGHTGSITVAPADGNNPLYLHGGFLKVSDNGHYLTYSDNIPFFWLGDTWWYSPGEYMPFDWSSNQYIASCFKWCVDKRKSQGYNIVHFGFLGYLKGYANPLDFWKTHQINPGYWQEVDKYIEYATKQGIMPQIAMLWPQDLHNTLDDWQTIWKYFIARYGAYPITWDFSTEYSSPYEPDLPAIIQLVKALGQYIKDNDPYQRAMTIMPWWYKGDLHQVWGQPWHDFTQLDGSHEDPYGASINILMEVYNTNTPGILVETTFEGITRNGYGPYDDSVVRNSFYRAMQCGFAGFTYGSNGLWYPKQNDNDHTFEDVWGPALPWWLAALRPGGYQMGYLKNFYQSIRWWELEPRPDSIITDPPLTENQRVLPKLTPEEDVIVVYFPKNNSPTLPATLQLNTSKNAHYRAAWFNPRTASYNNLPAITVAGTTIALPDRADSNDWVLLLQENPKGDLNDDGAVNHLDLKIMSQNWLKDDCSLGNLNGDCLVNYKDFASMAENWLK